MFVRFHNPQGAPKILASWGPHDIWLQLHEKPEKANQLRCAQISDLLEVGELIHIDYFLKLLSFELIGYAAIDNRYRFQCGAARTNILKCGGGFRARSVGESWKDLRGVWKVKVPVHSVETSLAAFGDSHRKALLETEEKGIQLGAWRAKRWGWEGDFEPFEYFLWYPQTKVSW